MKFKKPPVVVISKIINQSVPVAASQPGLQREEAEAIVKYAAGAASFAGALLIEPSDAERNARSSPLMNQRLDAAVASAFDILSQ